LVCFVRASGVLMTQSNLNQYDFRLVHDVCVGTACMNKKFGDDTRLMFNDRDIDNNLIRHLKSIHRSNIGQRYLGVRLS
jgi:hypothetical protein